MPVPSFIHRLGAVVVASLALALVALPAGASAAQRVDAAVVAGSGPKGIGAVCARLAKRKTLRIAPRVSGAPGSRSRKAARKRRRVGAAARRHCIKRLRRAAAKRHAQKSTLATEVSGPLVIGVDGGYADWSDSETEQRAVLGAAVTRHEWDPAEPVDAQDDVVLSAAAEVHTRIHALLGGNQLGDPTHYREWVVGFIQRYGAGGAFWKEHPELDQGRYAITTFELGNEPYFGEMSPEAYADTVRPTLEEVKRLGLPAKLVLPSRVYGDNTSWMDTLYERIPDLNDLFYAFADHPYWYGHDPAQVNAAGPFGRIEALRVRMNELGANTKPIFITEYGESTASCGDECVDEATQAAHLQEMIGAVISRPDWGVKMLSLFQLRDRGTGSGDRELQFGLLREDGSAKPSYSVVSAAMQQYRG
jgi:hypothetical protein